MFATLFRLKKSTIQLIDLCCHYKHIKAIHQMTLERLNDRGFKNKFPDYIEGTELLRDDQHLLPNIENEIFSNINKLLNYFESEFKSYTDVRDFSVYTGTAGIALLYYHLSKVFLDRKNEFIEKALELLGGALKRIKQRDVTFLCGEVGPLALAAVLYSEIGQEGESRKRLQMLKEKLSYVTNLQTDLPDEILYGRSGFLYALNFVGHHLKNQTIITDQDFRNVSEAIIKSGQLTYQKEKGNVPPLMYYWYGEAYVGAAHGFAGIYYLLLKNKHVLSEKEINELIKPSIDFLLSIQYRSGNFPACLGPDTDTLIHWCHGAPGLIYTMIEAYNTFGDEKYFIAAKRCADVIWDRGLLIKGYGICHGVAGNAYAFLAMYQLTQNKLYLYRAIKFAEWCFNYGKHGCRPPDTPFSLFEGLAGTIYFLADILNPKKSAFPSFIL